MKEYIIKSSQAKEVINDIASAHGYQVKDGMIESKIPGERFSIKTHTISDGIEIINTEGHINETVKFYRQKSKEDCFDISYFLNPFQLTDPKESYHFSVQNKKYWSNLKEDEIFYFSENTPFSLFSIKLSRSFIEKYNQNKNTSIDSMINSSAPFIIYENISKSTYQLIKEAKSCDFNFEIDQLKLSYLTYQILYNFANKISNRFSLDNLPKRFPDIDIEKVFKIKNHIEDNYMEVITVEKLSDLTDCSYSKLRKLFKDVTGISILQYINNYKLAKAHQWIKEGTHNVSDCTYALGFSSITHFGKLYKDKYGCTPSSMIKKIK
ncbi:helix-turn-helix transcriptional regulator [Flammeovirga pacifica]|uniref:HTH araC/xylS-type domain-containing protein n=1 Tax=Flammeovirga pacifica TaxID=915059 RepID=A0A1S1YV03_FLAPC|nr:AraC family transcriptional regulator [Flammeovirga pacifica]OHX64846.1 hypothetical protein NH26_00065 [Flammeovirga pacifica]